jgi:Zn-finger nucleic acid-binding protein
MRMVCPECYPYLKNKGRDTIECFLDRVDIFPQFPEAGQCPRCRKIWNDDGREILVTGQIKVELKDKEYNPSRRED